MRVSGILLAAGLSRRMGGRDKLLLDYKGVTLLRRASELLCGLPLYERIIVITGARLDSFDLPPGIRAVINPRPESGQSGSIRLGVEAASGDRYLFLSADQPRLTAAGILPLLEKAAEDKIIFPLVNGRPSAPAVFPARYRAELLGLTGDCGGRTLRDAYPEACLAV